MSRSIVISTSNEIIRIAPEEIVYASASGSYTELTLVDESVITFSVNLHGFMDNLIGQMGEDASTFMRIGKSLMVNREYIFRINPSKQQIVLATPMMAKRFNLSASKDALKGVKLFLESEL